MRNNFTPEKPTAYDCILYTTGAESPVSALFLAADADGDLGRVIEDTR
ncbi:MAG: hypothetical protein PHC88_07680 [Terrimicrobiaceae bacterium]|nr:hypothetical protein [Terrimicrobiaceae bacterium]